MVEDSFGRQFVLSNNHVLARVNNAQTGAAIVQPGLNDNGCKAGPNNRVANLSKFVRLNLAPGGLNTVDAAMARIRPNDVIPTILNIGGISNVPVSPILGLRVQKMGSASCLTTGTISAVEVNIKVNYAGNKSANFVNQFTVTTPSSQPFNIPGDSGSLVLTSPSIGVCPQPVGLLFAQSTSGSSNISVQNPIVPILTALKVQLVASCNQLLEAPSGDFLSQPDSQEVVGESVVFGQTGQGFP